MILESSFVFVILLFLCFSSYNDIVNQIIYGIATGEVIFLFIFSFILSILKNKKINISHKRK